MQNGTTSAPVASSSLRSRQIAALKQMINFNQLIPNSLAVEPVWKILIFDKFGQNILSPLISVKELREAGVTLHLSLHTERESLPDVPAVYFVSPDEKTIAKICQDLISGLYESYYFNFIGSINRPRMEELAGTAVQTNCFSQIQKIYDQYLNFISLEDDLFTLRRHDASSSMSFYGINRSEVVEAEMIETIDSMVDGLFSVCVTLGTVPVIRSPRGNAAELVAEKLDKKIRENLRDARNNLFTGENVRAGQMSFQRPVLIVFDRSMDLATPLHHTWTYQALIHDVLNFDLNRVVLPDIVSGGTKKTKEYDMNANDKLWMSQKGSPFPAVAEAVQEELESYRSSEDEIIRLKHVMGLDSESDETISMLTDTNAKLTSAVSSLPELLERKRLIDMHMNVATAVLEQIKTRKLDAYFEAEEKLMNRQLPDRPLLDMIKDSECGSLEDKQRILLIQYICSDMSENELSQYISSLEAANCDTSALKYVKRWKSFAKILPKDQYTGGGTKTVSMFSKLLTTSSQFVMEGVKNLVIKKHNLPITRIIDAIMDMKSVPEIEDYRYFDPKLLRTTSENIPRNKSPFNEAIVFVIGGGTYVEYQNLVDYRKTKVATTPKKITYGCTDLVNAAQFLSQLTSLGKEI